MTSIGNSIDSIRTINRQDHQDQQQDQQQDQKHYNYYNNYIHTDPGVHMEELPGNEILDQIAEAYRANIAPVITQAAAMVIERALRSGMEPATVIMAIEETGLASKPSPYYLRAILRNWAEFGVVTSHARDTWQTTDARPWWR